MTFNTQTRHNRISWQYGHTQWRSKPAGRPVQSSRLPPSGGS